MTPAVNHLLRQRPHGCGRMPHFQCVTQLAYCKTNDNELRKCELQKRIAELAARRQEQASELRAINTAMSGVGTGTGSDLLSTLHQEREATVQELVAARADYDAIKWGHSSAQQTFPG